MFVTHAQDAPPLQWAHRTGSSYYDGVTALKADADGNLLVAGQIGLTVDMDPGEAEVLLNAGSAAGFVSKYDTTGALLWAKMFKTTNSISRVVGMGTDAAGNIYAAGSFSGTCDFNPGTATFNISTATSPYLASDIFIVKMDAAGNFIWAKAIQATPTIEKSVLGMAVTPQGSVYITGLTADGIDFDPSAATAISTKKGIVDSYIAKYSTDGAFEWVKTYGATVKSAIGFGVAANDEAVYATGTFGGNVDFGTAENPMLLTGHGPNIDTYILKLTANGTLAWAKNIVMPLKPAPKAWR